MPDISSYDQIGFESERGRGLKRVLEVRHGEPEGTHSVGSACRRDFYKLQ
jgi:hypothetical protein